MARHPPYMLYRAHILGNFRLLSFPEWNVEGPKMRSLAVGIEEVLSKSFIQTGGGEREETE